MVDDVNPSPAGRRQPGASTAERGPLGLSGSDVERLFGAEGAKLRGAVSCRIGDVEEAADIVQDAFARLLQARPSEALRTPAAYLRRIVRNLLQDRSKRAEHRFVVRGAYLTEKDMPSMPPEQEWGLEAEDLRNRYEAAIAALSPRTREVFLLHRVEELRYRDIAAQLSISVATVEYHMARALTLLDEALD